MNKVDESAVPETSQLCGAAEAARQIPRFLDNAEAAVFAESLRSARERLSSTIFVQMICLSAKRTSTRRIVVDVTHVRLQCGDV